MQALIVEFVVHAPWVDAFAEAIVDNARASREQEAGCRQFDVCRDPADPTLFFLYELYDDEAAVQAHLRSAHYLHMNTITSGWVREKIVRRFLRLAGD